ncbi:MAG TPA: hypothetical protein PKW60_11510 [Candidatus Hydrogenedentes bacterium]|jgi:hypothetical protein|nr:hypothetical protein [Candidatus Hydrogenedentota bacterium]
MPSRRLPVAALAVAGVVVLVMILSAKGPMSSEELARRVMKCEPSWSNYDEDLKAQIGAAPVAEWKGEPAEARWEAGELRVSFAMLGVWAGRDAAIPVLVKLPNGETHRNEAAAWEDGRLVYQFTTSLQATPQWVIVRYPFYGERRLVLSEDGRWESAEH